MNKASTLLTALPGTKVSMNSQEAIQLLNTVFGYQPITDERERKRLEERKGFLESRPLSWSEVEARYELSEIKKKLAA